MAVGTGILREQNNHKILKLLVRFSEITKKELAVLSCLSVATVGTILNDFVIKKVIIEKETVYSKLGRPTKVYSLNPDYFHAMCLAFIKKNNNNYLIIKVIDGLAACKYIEEIELKEVNTSVVLAIIKKYLILYPKIKIIGLGVPAIVSDQQIIESDIIELIGIDLKYEIEREVAMPIILKNDINYTVYGFYCSMVTKKDLCYMTFPKNCGPGCGTVINGTLLEGHNTIAGEILYLPFFNYLKQKEIRNFIYNEDDIALSICCVASIINPALIVLTGEGILNKDIVKIKHKCLEYLPQEFMPEIVVNNDYEKDYLQGIEKIVIETYMQTIA